MQVQDIPILRYGEANRLSVRTRDEDNAELGPNDVRIAVKYSGINFADVQMRLGQYYDAPPRPFVPGYEVSGVVDAVGSEVERYSIGDEVVAGTYFGGYTSTLVVPAQQVFPLPASTSLAEGAALPVNFFTAYCALFEMGRVREGDRVLIECATGGVGTLAVQMARYAGAEVIGLTTSPDKKAYIEALGARAMTLDEFYADESAANFDFILNASGGRDVKKQMNRLGLCGRIVCIGINASVRDGKKSTLRLLWTALRTPIIPVLALFNKNRGVFGFNGLTVLQDPVWVERLTGKLALIDEMGLRPHVDKIFPAADVAEAHRFLETKQARGKVLIGW
jgi:NADPH:quinone reductase-like Zn-dependent oxidoreductase